jgi:hypothetical protein
MALLIVVAEATTGLFLIQGSGSMGMNNIAGPALAVSVTTADGTPVDGLKESNFKVRFLAADQVNPNFLPANLVVVNEQIPGLYLLGLQPVNVVVPPKGCQKCVYSIAVTHGGRGGDRGQTLTSLQLSP